MNTERSNPESASETGYLFGRIVHGRAFVLDPTSSGSCKKDSIRLITNVSVSKRSSVQTIFWKKPNGLHVTLC